MSYAAFFPTGEIHSSGHCGFSKCFKWHSVPVLTTGAAHASFTMHNLLFWLLALQKSIILASCTAPNSAANANGQFFGCIFICATSTALKNNNNTRMLSCAFLHSRPEIGVWGWNLTIVPGSRTALFCSKETLVPYSKSHLQICNLRNFAIFVR